MSYEVWGEPDDGPELPVGWMDEDDVGLMRELLAQAYSGGDLYTDDGELQDNRVLPTIDFQRDTPGTIQEKIQKRAALAQIIHAPAGDEIPGCNRWRLVSLEGGVAEFAQDNAGPWVSAVDYLRLQARLEAAMRCVVNLRDMEPRG